MKLVIDDTFSNQFAYNYLPKLIGDYILHFSKSKKLDKISEVSGVNYNDFLKEAIKQIKVRHSGSHFEYSFNKNAKYFGVSYELLINRLTYGTLDVKGYPIIEKVFDYIRNNVSYIYEDYINGN